MKWKLPLHNSQLNSQNKGEFADHSAIKPQLSSQARRYKYTDSRNAANNLNIQLIILKLILEANDMCRQPFL